MPTPHVIVTGLVAAAAAGAFVLPATAAAAPTSRHVVTVHLSGSTAAFGATSTPPGWTHFRDTGKAPVVIMRGTGQSAAALAADYNHERFAQIDRHFPIAVTVDSAEPGDGDSYARLRSGTYFVIDGYHGTGTWKSSQIGRLTVSGATRNSPLPARANTIRLDKQLDIHAASRFQRLPFARIVDTASRWVDIEAFTISPTTTAAAIKRFLAHPSLKKVDTLDAHSKITLGQTAAPSATIYNHESLRRGREMLISFTSFTQKLHRGQARMITVG